MKKSSQWSVVCGQFVGLAFVVVFFLSFIAFTHSKDTNDAKLLEIGNGVGKQSDKKQQPNEIKIISYNIRWRGGNDLKKLIELFKSDKEIGGAQILGLQEVDRNKKRTRNENTVKTLAQALAMNYVWAAPPNAKGKERDEEETGVAILSAFPLSDVTRIVLPNEGPGGRRRVAIGATVSIGPERIRLYSIHAETRIKSELKLEQLATIIEDFEKRRMQIMRVVVLGDFNTVFPQEIENTAKLFNEKGFSTPFSNDLRTWRQFLIELKLDWLWLRGFQVKDFGIDKEIELSDHWPLWAKVSLNETNPQTNLNEKLRQELLQMEKVDQEVRNKLIAKKFQDRKLIEKQQRVDIKTTRRLHEIVTLFGWPSAQLVGKDGANAAFILLQHSPDYDFQKQMLPFVEAAAKRGDIPADNYVLLVDRTRIHDGKPQLYGTQASIKDGKLIVDPIEDEERVDERRKALGLPLLSEYLKELGELYKMPVEWHRKTSP